MIDFVQWKNLFTKGVGSAAVSSLLKIAQVGLGLSICRGECGRYVDGWMGLSFLTGQPCSSMAKSDSGGSWRRSGSGAKCQSSCFTPANYACDSFVICPANKLQVDLIGRPFSRRKRFCRIPSRSPWDGRGAMTVGKLWTTQLCGTWNIHFFVVGFNWMIPHVFLGLHK